MILCRNQWTSTSFHVWMAAITNHAHIVSMEVCIKEVSNMRAFRNLRIHTNGKESGNENNLMVSSIYSPSS